VETVHRILEGDARDLSAVASESVHLVVTSPPYPMIAMWDGAFVELDPRIGDWLADEARALDAFEAMHTILDGAWAECARALVPGGMLCIDVGDATRSVGGRFRCYANRARITAAMMRLGLDPLPAIVWRKPTNAPNKFMGSGMLPPGAYVTYEHEHIVLFRKGAPRAFRTPEDRERRAKSAYFWEERNVWFSDLWTLGSVPQSLDGADRPRSGAFPFELAFRLVAMFSLYGDVVLDPFVGTGTTCRAALALGRSSVGVERAPSLAAAARGALAETGEGAARVMRRLSEHAVFARDRELKHHNQGLDLGVMTSQETALEIWAPQIVRPTDTGASAHYVRIARDRVPVLESLPG
jgi:site-specific DNA-methyltransferase (cytosine-N4-specific)